MPNRGNRTSQHIRTIRKSLRTLDRTLRSLAVSVRVVSRAGTRAEKAPRRKLTLTPARRAALKLQGKYMGYIRGLKPKQKAQVKAAREGKGIRAAIAAARRMGRAA